MHLNSDVFDPLNLNTILEKNENEIGAGTPRAKGIDSEWCEQVRAEILVL